LRRITRSENLKRLSLYLFSALDKYANDNGLELYSNEAMGLCNISAGSTYHKTIREQYEKIAICKSMHFRIYFFGENNISLRVISNFKTSMKQLLTLSITLFALTTFGQQMTSKEWDEEAKTNIRLLPKYGYITKSEGQIKADQEFINLALEKDSTNRKASAHLVQIGFNYLYRDIKTAMYRFNQAYLLDSTNTDIYWGYGGVYMILGEYEKAKQQYLEGLFINPKNTHLLTDYATYLMTQFYALQPIDKKGALTNLDSAIIFMTKSYQIDPTDQNTTFKLSICYWNNGDCINAWKFYDICKALGGQPITKEYTNDLNKKCNRNK